MCLTGSAADAERGQPNRVEISRAKRAPRIIASPAHRLSLVVRRPVWVHDGAVMRSPAPAHSLLMLPCPRRACYPCFSAPSVENPVTATSLDQQAPASPARRDHVPLGIVYMLAASILFALSSAASKWLVATYPFGEVLFSRALGSLVLVSLVVLPHTGLAVFRTVRLRDHLARGISQSFSQAFLIIA